MRLRQLVLACSLSSFVLSPYASALGLGEVKLKSSLNQPLEAEVKLLDTRDLTAEQILVTLASPADFERNGVDRLYFYTELQFQVDLESADGPKVIIRSRNPVREPYLNFLIEARWTAGRLLREYTLLMDLPTFEDNVKPATVNAAATSAPVQRFRETPSAVPRTAPSSVATASRTAVSAKPALSGDQYEVRANDTLWEIALRARPNSSVSIHQSMMALYRANPEAFINGNINKLRRGQVLRIPDASDMTSVAKTEAVNQFAQATGDSSYGAQLNASRRSNAAPTESAEISGRVKLAAPSAGANNSGQGSGANNGTGRALEGELAATLEELDKAKSENTELGSRVKDLESQIETMERLVALSNEKLRALQLAAGQEPTPVESASTLASQDSTVVAAVATSAETVSSSAAAVQSTQPTLPKPAAVVQQPVREQGIFDSLKENPLWLALALLGVFGAGAAAYAYRRRQQAEEEQLEEDSVFAFDESSIGHSDDAPNDDVAESINESLFEEEAEPTAVAETGDVVGEADIYIAYGKLDQAEEMLLNALDKDPQSTDIRMKLLEVYAQQQNASGFDKHYSVLLPIAGAALLSRATELRETISTADEFSAPAHVSSSIDDDFSNFSLDELESNDLLGSDAASTQPVAEVDGEFNFDFDLDDDEATIASLGATDAAQPASLDDVSGFDFDLADVETNLSLDPSGDLAELSLALDKHKTNPIADVESTSLEINTAELDEDFSFDFEDDLDLADALPNADADLESLEVAADDFNLDMDVDDVDLAALDHEMESLDVDLDDELDLADEPAITHLETTAIVKEDKELAELSGQPIDLDVTTDADEILGFELDNENPSALDNVDNVDDLQAFAESLEMNDLQGADQQASEAVVFEQPAVEDQEEDLFAEALSGFGTESDELNIDAYSSDESILADLSDEEMDSELDFLADADEAATKLDLARAYIDMGDTEGAKDILSEVVHEGSDDQRKEAAELLGRIV